MGDRSVPFRSVPDFLEIGENTCNNTLLRWVIVPFRSVPFLTFWR
jgi:hypothetical protein